MYHQTCCWKYCLLDPLMVPNNVKMEKKDSLVHSLQHPDGLLPPLVLLLPLQVLGNVDLRVQRHEAPQLQRLAALMESPQLVTFHRPLHADPP